MKSQTGRCGDADTSINKVKRLEFKTLNLPRQACSLLHVDIIDVLLFKNKRVNLEHIELIEANIETTD
jgi:hypothetical protein